MDKASTSTPITATATATATTATAEATAPFCAVAGSAAGSKTAHNTSIDEGNKSPTSYHRDCKLKKSFPDNSDKAKNADSDDCDDAYIDNKDDDKDDDMDEKCEDPKVLKRIIKKTQGSKVRERKKN